MIEIYKKILVQIFGDKNKKLVYNCDKCNVCNTCRSCSQKSNNCGGLNNNNSEITVWDMYKDLQRFINTSNVFENVQLEFIDISQYKNLDEKYPGIKDLIDRGYEAPFTLIDNIIIRYYGSISNVLVYKDVLELLD